MTKIRHVALIDASPEETFDLYMDADRRAEWNPSARGLLEQIGPPNEAGSRYVVDTRFGPFAVQLLRVERPHVIEMMEGPAGRSGVHVLMRFDRLKDGRTRFQAESTFKPEGRLGRLKAPLNAFAARIYSRIELRRFKAAAERSSSRRASADDPVTRERV
jgi:uncharacterized protein YndB with AHSA1/START domain